MSSQGTVRCACTRSAKLDARAPTNAIRSMEVSSPAYCRRPPRAGNSLQGNSRDVPPRSRKGGDLAGRARSLRRERHLLPADGCFHHRSPDGPHEDGEPIDEARVRGGPRLEDDGRGIGRELDPPLLQDVQSLLVLEDDDLAVGLPAHLETEGRLAQVGVAD